MKKTVALLAFALLGTGALRADPVDMIVLLDTSQGMLPYFADATNFLFKDIVADQLRDGDTFHLLTFSGRPDVDLVRQIEAKSDVDDIVNHLLLLQPIGRYTDLVLAVKYLYQYTVDLPLSSRKEILILTNGIHDPPPGSSFPIKLGPDGKDISGNQKEIEETAQEIRRRGWDVHFLQFPLKGAENQIGTAATQPTGGATAAGTAGSVPSSAGATKGANDALLQDLAATVGAPISQYQESSKADMAHVATGAPGIQFPADLGTVGYTVDVPFVVRNYQQDPVIVELDHLMFNGTDLLQEKTSVPVMPQKTAVLKARVRLPSTLAPGKNSIAVDLSFSGTPMIFPHEGSLTFTLRKGAFGAAGAAFYLLVAVFVVVLALCILLVFFLVRRIVASLAAAPAASALPKPMRIETGHLSARSIKTIELRVQGQNRRIGGRNIHAIGSGTRKSVGGGSSSFLIYLYPTPTRIGDLEYDGDQCTFVPLRDEYFPDLAGPLANCLGREIRLQTKEKRDVILIFREYVSPLESVNRIMHLADQAGVTQPIRR